MDSAVKAMMGFERFLPPATLATIVGCSMLVGWLGCHLSVKQYVKV